ncbi:MAG: hypothetical protein SF069_06820 [Phycisphaerae bacterium]|nr:hypothetical protein [Phycisphaerae bacterium]
MVKLSQLVRWKLLTAIGLIAIGCAPPTPQTPDPGGDGQAPPADDGGNPQTTSPQVLLGGLGDSARTEDLQLTWSQVVGAQFYRVSLSRDAQPAFLINVQNNGYLVPQLSACTDYFWKVEAITATGSVPSQVGKFRTRCPTDLPTKPLYPSPSNEDFGVVPATPLRWQPVVGAESYEVYFGSYPTPPFVGSTPTPEFANLPLLAVGGQYHWKVVARNRFGTTESPTWTFRITSNPTGPGTARFLEPIDNARQTRTRLTLRWSRSSEATEYDVYLGTSAGNLQKLATVTSRSYELSNLAFDTRYLWRIVSRGATGETVGPVWSFATAPLALPPVVADQPQPANNAFGVAADVKLSWRADADTDSYDVYLSPGSQDPVLVGTVTRPPFTPPAALELGREYNWRVVAKNAQGAVSGPTWRFVVRSVDGGPSDPPVDPDDGPDDPDDGPNDPPAPPVTSNVNFVRDGCLTRFDAKPAARLDVSDDGRFLAVEGVRVVDRLSGIAMLVSISTSGRAGRGSYPSLSANGRFVVFESPDSLAANDTNTFKDIYVHDRQNGTTTCLTPGANERSVLPNISADGRFVSFASWASNLLSNDSNNTSDIFVVSVETGAMERLTNGVMVGGQPSVLEDSSLSADGRYVAYTIRGSADDGVWLHDRQSGNRIKLSDRGFTYAGGISDDGSVVAFTGYVAGATEPQALVAQPFAGVITLASAGPGGVAANQASWLPTISGDGRFVFYSTLADNLGPPNGALLAQVYRFDRQSGTNLIVSSRNQTSFGNGLSFYSASSRDGSIVAFDSSSTNLVSGGDPPGTQVFVSECLP